MWMVPLVGRGSVEGRIYFSLVLRFQFPLLKIYFMNNPLAHFQFLRIRVLMLIPVALCIDTMYLISFE